MAREPLPIGTCGNISIRTINSTTGNRYKATTLFRDVDGTTRQVSRSGKSKAAAERALKESLIDRTPTGSEKITRETYIRDLAEIYTATRKQAGEVKPQTLQLNNHLIHSYIIPKLGNLKIREVTTGTINSFLLLLAESSPHQARIAKSTLNGMFQCAALEIPFFHNPVDNVKIKRPQRVEPKALTEADIKDIEQVIVEWQNRAGRFGPKPGEGLLDILNMLLATGCRIGELLALTWDNVDLKSTHPSITINSTVVQINGTGLSIQPNPKSDTSNRTIYLPEFGTNILLRRSVESHRNALNLVFPSSTGTLQSPNNLRRTMRNALKGTRYEGVTPHSFRKTVATAISRVAGEQVAAAQLGHSSPTITREHYIERSNVAPDSTEIIQALYDHSPKAQAS